MSQQKKPMNLTPPTVDRPSPAAKPSVLIGGEFLRIGRRPPPKPRRDGTIALVVGGVALLLAIGAGVLALVGAGGTPQPTDEELTQTATAVQATADAFAALQNGLGAVELGQTAVATEVSGALAGLQVNLTADSAALVAQVANLQATVDAMGTAQGQPQTVFATNLPDPALMLTPGQIDEQIEDEPIATEAPTDAAGTTETATAETDSKEVTITVISSANIRNQPGVIDTRVIANAGSETILVAIAKIDLGEEVPARYWIQVRLDENIDGLTISDETAQVGYVSVTVLEATNLAGYYDNLPVTVMTLSDTLTSTPEPTATPITPTPPADPATEDLGV